MYSCMSIAPSFESFEVDGLGMMTLSYRMNINKPLVGSTGVWACLISCDVSLGSSMVLILVYTLAEL